MVFGICSDRLALTSKMRIPVLKNYAKNTLFVIYAISLLSVSSPIHFTNHIMVYLRIQLTLKMIRVIKPPEMVPMT